MAFHNVPPNGFPDLPDVEELEAVQKDVTTLKTTTTEQGAAITNLNTEKANKTDIATDFSDLTNYNAGDLVYYDGALYEFQVDHTAGAWETSEVIQKDLSDIVTTLMSGLTEVNSKLTYMIINQITEVTFDENGRGTFTIPEDYHPLIASLDEAWFTAMHYNNGNFYVTAHSTADPTVLIKSTTVTYYWFLYFC